MDSNKEKFLYGPAFGLIGESVIFIPITTAIPSWSMPLFIVNICLIVILTFLARYLYKTIPEEKWYNSLVNFLMLISMAFYFVMPLLRITFHTSLFWFCLFLYVFLLIYTVFKREKIFQAFYKPGESKLAKGTIAVFIVIMILGGLTARNGQDMVVLRLLDEKQGVFWVSSIIYAVGLLVTFISSAFLKKTDIEKY